MTKALQRSACYWLLGATVSVACGRTELEPGLAAGTKLASGGRDVRGIAGAGTASSSAGVATGSTASTGGLGGAPSSGGSGGAGAPGVGGAFGGAASNADGGAAGQRCAPTLFLPAQAHAVGSMPVAIESADLNGDGLPDLATVNRVSDRNDVPFPSATLSLLLATGDGGFALSELPADGRQPSDLALGDVNLDGNIDLVVAYRVVVDRASLSLGNGDGTFGAPQRLESGESPGDANISDLNRDGLPDIALSGYWTSDTVLFLAEGKGAFTRRVLYPGPQPSELAVGDVDGDGADDLVVGVGNLNGSWLRPMAGDGLGGFMKLPLVDPGTFSTNVTISDVNNDGLPDLLCGAASSLAILLNRGGWSFDAPRLLEPAAEVDGMLALDLDLDGRVDLALTARDTGEVLVLLGDGTGTFAPSGRYPVGRMPNSLVSADFNRDGRPDLAVSNYGSNDVSILLGTDTTNCLAD